jgi:hypothetical protein
MNNYKITIFQHLAIGLFSLTILAQNCIAAPVLCFESDGRINIETNCNSDCDTPKATDHQDDCGECVDIQLWNYNPDIAFLVKSTNSDIDIETINSEFNYLNYFQQNFSAFHCLEPRQAPFPLFLKNTILLI